MLDDMLALLDSPSPSAPSATKTPSVLTKSPSLDLLSDYNLVGEDNVFDELMADLSTSSATLTSPKSLTRNSSLTLDDDMFSVFANELDAEVNAQEFEDDILSMGWLDDILENQSSKEDISV